MYRDRSTALDEHDRAVGAILIGEALIDSCVMAAARIRRGGTVDEPERWRAVTEVHDAYPEIWRHLDRARRILAGRGINTAGYDELRPHARRAPTHAKETKDRLDASIDGEALHDAKRAAEELKLSVPGADWHAIEARTAGLVGAPLSRRRRQRLVVGAVMAAFSLAVIAWLAAIVPVHKVGRGETMRRELAVIQQQRKLRIELLTAEVGTTCDRTPAQELVKLLVLDGRGPDARNFGDTFISRCGGDPVVEHWAHAPRPGH